MHQYSIHCVLLLNKCSSNDIHLTKFLHLQFQINYVVSLFRRKIRLSSALTSSVDLTDEKSRKRLWQIVGCRTGFGTLTKLGAATPSRHDDTAVQSLNVNSTLLSLKEIFEPISYGSSRDTQSKYCKFPCFSMTQLCAVMHVSLCLGR